MWKDSTKRSFVFVYTLTLLCPGQITSLLVSTTAEGQRASPESTAVVLENESSSSEGFSLLSWIFGKTPLAKDIQEANLFSAQLDELINEELQINQQVEEHSFTVRRRRSPQDISVATSSDSTWYSNLLLWLRSSSQTNSGAVDYQSNQLNQELTNALGPPDGSSQDPMSVNSKTNTKDPDTINGMSPIEIFKQYMPDGATEDAVVSVNDWWNDPDNTSYVRAIVITWKVVAFVTPGLGIIEQINFTIACTKLVWKTTKMYCEGSDMTDITVAILPDLAYLIFMGQAVDISSMDTTDFVKYIHSLHFPALPEAKEAELRADVNSLLNKFYKQSESMVEDQREYTIDLIVNTTKFLAFFKPQGSMKVNRSDAIQGRIFAEVYGKLMSDKGM